jgi:hypothetical protein
MNTTTIRTERVHCDCEDWVNEMKTIQYALEAYDALGFDSGMKRFEFCPYCGTELHVTVTSNAALKSADEGGVS